MYSLFFTLILFTFMSNTGEQLTTQEAKYVLAVAGWPQSTHADALEVVWCESRRIPPRIGDNGNSVGLFQIQWTPESWVGWRSYPPMESLRNKDISNPITNAKAAFIIYKNFGWEPWTCKP